MRLTIITATALALVLGSVSYLGGCQARYRYPCQDPANWGRSECHNDACKAEGTCTSDTLGNRNDINMTESQSSDEEPTGEPTEEPAPEEKKTEEEPSPVISNNTVAECKPPVKKVNFGVKSPQPPPPLFIEKQIGEENTALKEKVLTTVEGEQPVTMDTIVETAEHNEAAR